MGIMFCVSKIALNINQTITLITSIKIIAYERERAGADELSDSLQSENQLLIIDHHGICGGEWSF